MIAGGSFVASGCREKKSAMAGQVICCAATDEGFAPGARPPWKYSFRLPPQSSAAVRGWVSGGRDPPRNTKFPGRRAPPGGALHERTWNWVRTSGAQGGEARNRN